MVKYMRDQDRPRPRRRALASVTVRVDWRGQTIEREIEVSDEAGAPVLRQILDQLYEQAHTRLNTVEAQLFAAEEDAEALAADSGRRLCRAIVVRQKAHGEVREPCGTPLTEVRDPDGSGSRSGCLNYRAHLATEDLVVDPIYAEADAADLELEREQSRRQQLVADYIDRYATAPPENASVAYLIEATTRD